MWWPIVIMFLWCVFMMWPRVDGGNVPYGGLVNVVPAWFSFGPIIVIWFLWAILVAMLG
jgi:hypothetical protein